MSTTPFSHSGIVVEGLTKSYGTVKAVRGIDLSIDPGETVAFLGPNGAGKSTTIDMLLGLIKPDSGSIKIFEHSPSEAVALGLIGGMLQTGALIDGLSVLELLRLAASLYPNPLKVNDVLEATGTKDIARRRTTKLSGGQSQRVRFALAIIANPELLVLDEPTASLDVEGRRDFWETMRGVAELGKTVVFATHYLDEADAYADRIVLMAQGRLIADGPATEIKAKVGGRTISATLKDVELDVLRSIPGVTNAERHGTSIFLSCNNSDAALRTLLNRFADIHDIEIRGAGLEEAFVELVADAKESEGLV